jgi:hypothetical protein
MSPESFGSPPDVFGSQQNISTDCGNSTHRRYSTHKQTVTHRNTTSSSRQYSTSPPQRCSQAVHCNSGSPSPWLHVITAANLSGLQEHDSSHFTARYLLSSLESYCRSWQQVGTQHPIALLSSLRLSLSLNSRPTTGPLGSRTRLLSAHTANRCRWHSARAIVTSRDNSTLT